MPEGETGAGGGQPTTYSVFANAAADVAANVGGSVHGTLEIHTSLDPSEATLVARCSYSPEGPLWEPGPLGRLQDGAVVPV